MNTPKCSMYGLLAYIWWFHVGKYTIYIEHLGLKKAVAGEGFSNGFPS